MKTRSLLSVALALAAACAADPQNPAGSNTGSGGSDEGSGGSGGTSTKGGSSGKGGAGGAVGTGGSSAGGSSGSGGGSAATGGSGSTAGSGGSGGSGGKSDASSDPEKPDGGSPPTEAGGGTASCEGAKFCDDFEGQSAGKPPTGMFKVDTAGGGSLVVDGSKAFSGKQSILIKAPAGGGYPGNWLTFTDIASKIPSNDLHGRAMIFLAQTPGNAHWDTINASGPLASGGNATYILGGMYKKFMSVYHPGDCSVDSSTPFPTGRWACIQWEFRGNKDGTHLHKMMLDGQVVNNGIQDGSQGFCVQGGAKRDWKAPTFSTLKVGHVHYGSSPGPIELWIDDLAFGEQAIPCPAAK